MHPNKGLCIFAFIVLSINSGVFGWWSWNREKGPEKDQEKEKIPCYTKCMTTGEWILGVAFPSLCSALCRHNLDCITRRIDGMKGLDEYLIQAKWVLNLESCEYVCNHLTACMAFRYLQKNRFCFLYSEQKYIEEDISESSFYVKHCISCSMKSIKNAKGPDDEIQTVWEEPSFKDCENNCIKFYDCIAVHFDGKRCFKFTSKVEPKEKKGIDFSEKICVKPLNYDGKKQIPSK